MYDRIVRFNIMTPGEKLKAFRENRGWNREQLAVELGCGYEAIKSWELNRRKPNRYFAAKIEGLTYFDSAVGRIGALDW